MTVLELTDTTDFRESWTACEPTTRERSLPWAERHIVNENGQLYNHHAYPHLGAPGGPFDAFDDYNVREIVLQWASRLGKTFFGQCCSIYNGTKLRLPQIFGGPKEELVSQIVQRTYRMIRQVPELRSKLVKPERMQNQHLVEFWGCNMFVGWARSAATFADKDCSAGHAAELDDWDHLTTSKDGDPADQFTERFKNHWSDRKVVYESIPKIRGRSRIEARRLRGWACEFYCPCPHCQGYQRIEFGDKSTEHGVKWEIVNGTLTAWYQCVHCMSRIENHQRAAMFRRGVWCPDGCQVLDRAALDIDTRHPDYKWSGWKNAPWITGTPTRNNEIASYRLESLVALSLSWNDCASQFLGCKNQPQRLRNFRNQWLAQTWEIRRSRSEPDEIAKRVATEYPHRVVPEWAEFLSIGADRQRADGGYVVFVVIAHGPDEMVHVVDSGTADSLDQMWQSVGRRPYYKPDGGEPLYVVPCAADSGWDAPGTYAFCQDERHPNCVPCKGGNTSGETVAYKWTDLKDSGYETDGMSLLLVSTNFTETALQHRLDTGTPNTPGGLGVYSDAAKDMDFIAQLSNAVLADKLDKRGEPVLLWVKKDEATPNDLRDAIRYGIAVAEAWRNDGSLDGTRQKIRLEKRPDGREWAD